ncbi:hypothetical protein [Mycolicibacterium palauense]|uniref:hypothetical protein n=1 Tax=Mycolicibacterium palauense TaxID=2034511 RepID=UPI000BFF188D|nr:hypothetical protein [Mycolicibacterium palauense]
MSSKLNPTPGLHQVVPNVDPELAVKITGRNAGAITYLLSLTAEKLGMGVDVTFSFASDGSLQEVVTTNETGWTAVARQGEYVVTNEEGAAFITQAEYESELRAL